MRRVAKRNFFFAARYVPDTGSGRKFSSGGKINQVFSIWLNSSSTGVARPKIVTDTRTLFLS